MFDVGFSELLVIGIVALIVIGPEKLPTVARTLGHLLGRAQRYVNDVKSDINREMQLDELKKLQSQLQTDVADSARAFEQTVHHEIQEAKTAVAAVAETAERMPVGGQLHIPLDVSPPVASASSASPPTTQST
jgi:sec-independent protein translocase protein TatB